MSEKFSGDVLIVEDNKVNQLVLKKQLERVGLTVIVAENGEEAIEILSGSLTFEIVFMDLQMPVMGGVECTQKIRAWNDERIHKLPIIAVTANVTDKDRRDCKECGMDGFLEKPLNKAKLLKELNKWCAA